MKVESYLDIRYMEVRFLNFVLFFEQNHHFDSSGSLRGIHDLALRLLVLQSLRPLLKYSDDSHGGDSTTAVIVVVHVFL